MVNSRRLLFLAVVIASLQLLWLLKYVPTYQYRWKSNEDDNSIEINVNSYSDPLRIASHHSVNVSVDTKYMNNSFEICHTFAGGLIPKSKSTRTLIIGASSFIGASIARLLHKSLISVVATDDNVNIGFDPMAWYRWEQLIGMDMSPQFVNYSNHEMALSFLKIHSPKTIIYVPTPLMEGEFNKSVREITELQENFVSLLKMLTKVSPSTNIILVSLRNPKTSYSSLIKLFELSLSVYNRLHHTNIAIVRINGIYGPWQSPKSKQPKSCYVGDLVNTLKKLLESDDLAGLDCFVQDYNCQEVGTTPLEMGLALTNQWIEEYNTYLSRQTKDIIASPFFTTKRNAQYPIEFMTNNYYFMENWFKNIYKMNLSMVVYHDDLSDKFVTTFMENYPKADFDKIKNFKDFRPNDRRYLAYYDYILAHPEIRRIVMTDMRDVIIQNNPFEMMDVLGDRPYVGLDRPFFHISRDTGVHGVYKRCFNKKSPINLDFSKEIDMLGYFNSGVTGGTRHVTLAILTKFLQLFKVSTKDNCNMAIVGYIYHKYYFDVLHMGWPFNTAFITDQPNIPGLSVLHKWDLLSYN